MQETGDFGRLLVDSIQQNDHHYPKQLNPTNNEENIQVTERSMGQPSYRHQQHHLNSNINMANDFQNMYPSFKENQKQQLNLPLHQLP